MAFKNLVRNIMSPNPVCASPTSPLRDVASAMERNGCGEIPICQNDKVVGVVTDRDIACRVVAQGKDPFLLTARDVMTRGVITVREDAPVDEAVFLMEAERLRRLPVVDDEGRIVGVLSQVDVAKRNLRKGGALLRSSPSPRRRPEQRPRA